MKKSEEDLLSSLRLALKDFKSEPHTDGRYESPHSEAKLDLDENELPLPYMMFLTLVTFSGFSYWGREEKVAWSIPILYKDIPFLLAYRKFGFDIRTPTLTKQTRKSAKEMISKLHKGIAVADKLLKPFAEAQIRKGNVTILNKYHSFNNRYRFFREQATQSFSKLSQRGTLQTNKTTSTVEILNNFSMLRNEGFYHATAMLDAYFSRLEHLLVLLLAFTDYNSKEDNLVKFIGSFWYDKFTRIFNIQKDAGAKECYDRLCNIKDRLRNPLSHGGFEKQGASLNFHVPVVGAIPVHLSRFKDSIHYSFHPIDETSFDDICSLFDDADKLLENGEMKFGMRYIDSGLNVAFDEDMLREYRQAIRSEKEIENFIQHLSDLSDMHTNMDW